MYLWKREGGEISKLLFVIGTLGMFSLAHVLLIKKEDLAHQLLATWISTKAHFSKFKTWFECLVMCAKALISTSRVSLLPTGMIFKIRQIIYQNA